MKIIGITVSLISFILILYQKRSKASYLSYLLPAGVFVVSGLIDTSMELVQKKLIPSQGQQDFFLFGLFISALLFSLMFSLIELAANTKKVKFSFDTILFGLRMGFFNYFLSKIVFLNVAAMGESIVFPVHNASVVMLTALIGFFYYKEKFSKKQWVGIALAIVSVVLIMSTL
ncbi:MAG: EamA family transporter [Clostridia bacterium]|nr:EamA family transporter [Clostridia bacterium]